MINFPSTPSDGQIVTLGENKYIWNSLRSQWKPYNVVDQIGATFSPTVTNTYDLGTTSLRWRNIYTNDLQLSNGIGDYTIVEGEEDLFLYNNKNVEPRPSFIII